MGFESVPVRNAPIQDSGEAHVGHRCRHRGISVEFHIGIGTAARRHEGFPQACLGFFEGTRVGADLLRGAPCGGPDLAPTHASVVMAQRQPIA